MNINLTRSVPLNTLSSIRAHRSVNNQSTTQLSDKQRQEVQQLKVRDRVVRAHEAAHMAAGGDLIHGGAHFSFQHGPDGVQYAIGGEVQIDTSEVSGDPQATLEKTQQIQAAALAPAQPSSQDRSVAAKAAQMAVGARAEINQQRNKENTNKDNSSSSNNRLTGQLLDLTV